MWHVETDLPGVYSHPDFGGGDVLLPLGSRGVNRPLIDPRQNHFL